MKTIILIVVFFMVLWLIVWFGWDYGKKQAASAKAYDKLYKEIQDDLSNLGKSNVAREVIRYNLIKLSKLKYKNRKRTEVLAMEFVRKFYCGKKKEVETMVNSSL